VAVDKIVLDTGNSWFALETRDCQDCLPGKYDYTLNPITYSQLPSSQAQLYVGDGLVVSGAQSVDWVCLSEDTDTCVPNFPFFSLQEIGLSDEVNGVLGLNANSADVLNNPRAPNFIDFLYDQGTIGARVFSVSLSTLKVDPSFVEFGFYDQSKTLVWINVYDSDTYDQFWWQNTLQGLRFRSPQEPYSVESGEEFSIPETLAIIDTASSCLRLP
jgi:hypothetical protein